MAPRTVGVLALCPTGNQQGGYYFYSLMSGQRLHRTHWTKLPIPAEVKDRVHALARHACASRGLAFTNSDGVNLDTLYPEDDDDSDYDPDKSDAASCNSSASLASHHDDASSTNSDHTSDSDDTDYDPDFNPDLPAPWPDAIAGVDGAADAATTNNNNNSDPGKTPGVDGITGETPRVDAESTGVDEDEYTDLATYVLDELEAELDNEIAALDSDYSSGQHKSDIELEDNVTPINEIHAAATQEQTSADQDLDDNKASDNEKSEQDNDLPNSQLQASKRP
jgi:hypothetical protein